MESQLADLAKQNRTVQAIEVPGQADGTQDDGAQVEIRELVTTFVPSKVGVGSVNMGALSLGGFEKRDREEKPITIVSADGAYLVGHNVERYTDLLERFDASKYADSPELRAVTRALFAQKQR